MAENPYLYFRFWILKGHSQRENLITQRLLENHEICSADSFMSDVPRNHGQGNEATSELLLNPLALEICRSPKFWAWITVIIVKNFPNLDLCRLVRKSKEYKIASHCLNYFEGGYFKFDKCLPNIARPIISVRHSV